MVSYYKLAMASYYIKLTYTLASLIYKPGKMNDFIQVKMNDIMQLAIH